MHDVTPVYDDSPRQTNLVRVNGSHAVRMTILKAGSVSTLGVIAGIKRLLPQTSALLPA